MYKDRSMSKYEQTGVFLAFVLALALNVIDNLVTYFKI